jgi:glycerophosphoryl diester phosphodiesterase
MIEKIIAHRGWQRRFPENTLASIQQALSIGAKHIEIDIQLSADHTAFLCHDQRLERICNSPININECSDDQLLELSAHEPSRFGQQYFGTPLSKLVDCIELISRHPDVTLYIEIKRQSLQTFGCKILYDSIQPLINKIVDQCFIISFKLEILNYFKHRQSVKLALVLSSWQQAFDPELKKINPAFIFCNFNLLPDEYNFADLPWPVAIYEISDYQQASALIQQGAALIETFAIGELIEQHKRHEGDSNRNYF